jgi:flagellar M-ring protein FliF
VNLEQLIAHLQKITTALSGKQIAGLVTVFVAVVAVVVGSAYWLSVPTYTLLVTDMDAETASSVVSRLQSGKVQYKLSDGGRTVSVPVERADELRLDFASGGLPSAGRIGFEIFDRPAFGTTEFLEQVNYRRALEGELARTISTLAEVSSARVHIAMARDSLFVDRDQPAKASVVLKLRASRPLAAATINGIAGLVSGSVEGLRPESVTILDTQGRPLTRPNDDAAQVSGTMQFERQQQIERDLTNRVVSLLEPVVGMGRVRVNVAAVLDADTIEQTEEVFDPEAVIRSRQTMTDLSASAVPTGGVAGARANLPPAASTAALPDAAGDPEATPPGSTPPAVTANADNSLSGAPAAPRPAGRTSETTNYEVGRVTRHTITPQGRLGRLSVAVILDDERVTSPGADGASAAVSTRSWEAEGLQRIHALVSAAVGLDPGRGDQLIVENIPFDMPEALPEPLAPGMGEQVTTVLKQYGPTALRLTAILGVALFALFGILRPLSRRALGMSTQAALPAAGASARLPTVSEMEGKIEAGQAGPAARLPALTQRVAKLASDEPEQLARIVRGWIAEGER